MQDEGDHKFRFSHVLLGPEIRMQLGVTKSRSPMWHSSWPNHVPFLMHTAFCKSRFTTQVTFLEENINRLHVQKRKITRSRPFRLNRNVHLSFCKFWTPNKHSCESEREYSVRQRTPITLIMRADGISNRVWCGAVDFADDSIWVICVQNGRFAEIIVPHFQTLFFSAPSLSGGFPSLLSLSLASKLVCSDERVHQVICRKKILPLDPQTLRV
jgi:hypothetical protein